MKHLLILIFMLTAVSGCGKKDHHKKPSPYSNSLSDSEVFVKANGVVQIEAAPAEAEYISGFNTRVWAFNGQVPGPTIHANIGDTVEVHYTNRLPEPSTLHWHGLELPANMDGSHISQKPVPPGESFTYKFKVLRAATYWYHPHVKPNEQVEKGLYGAIIVHDPKEDEKLKLPKKEITLILDDVLLNDDFQLDSFLPENPIERAELLTNGREGNYTIINGKHQPVYEVEEGVPVRLRFINSANSRFFRLSMKGQKIYRIGGDTGLIGKAEEVTEVPLVWDELEPQKISDPDMKKGLLIVPGERYEVIWVPKQIEDSEIVNLEWHDLKRGRHIGHPNPAGRIDLAPDDADGKLGFQSLVKFVVKKNSKEIKTLKIPENLRLSKNLQVSDLSKPEPLKVMFGHSAGDKDGNVMFFAKAMKKKDCMGMNCMQPIPMMKLTNKTALNAVVGETRIIEVVNMAMGIHPFHIHGFPFQLLDIKHMYMTKAGCEKIGQTGKEMCMKKVFDNSQNPNREWKDTLAIPGRPGRFRMHSMTIARLLIKFDNEHHAGELVAHGGQAEGARSGGWMVHCHILEHSRYGMATWLNLWPKKK